MLKSERGSAEVMSWVVVIPILLFFLMVGGVWLNLDRQKSISAMAARDAARLYGIELGQKNPNAEELARAKAKEILVSGGLMAPSSAFIPWDSYPARGQHGAGITIADSGTDVRVALRCHVVNPFPNVMKIIQGDAWPYHFSYVVTGKSRHEIEVD